MIEASTDEMSSIAPRERERWLGSAEVVVCVGWMEGGIEELERSEGAAFSGLEESESVWQSARGSSEGPRARRRRASRRRAWAWALGLKSLFEDILKCREKKSSPRAGRVRPLAGTSSRVWGAKRGASEARVTSRWKNDDEVKIDLHQIFQTENSESKIHFS